MKSELIGLLVSVVSTLPAQAQEIVHVAPETSPVRVLDLGRSKPGEGGQNGGTEEGDSSPDHQPSP